MARSDGGFEATGPAEAKGDGIVSCGATVTAAAPAGTAGAAKIPGDAGDARASRGGGPQKLWCGLILRQSVGSPGPMWAAQLGSRNVSQVVIREYRSRGACRRRHEEDGADGGGDGRHGGAGLRGGATSRPGRGGSMPAGLTGSGRCGGIVGAMRPMQRRPMMG